MKKASCIKKGAITLTLGLILVGTSGVAQAQDDTGLRLQYKVGDGLSIGDGDNLVHLQGRVQAQYRYISIENAADQGGFLVPRAEIRLDGFTLEKKIKYGFEMNLATRTKGTSVAACTATPTCTTFLVTTNSGLAALNDYYIDWVPTSSFGVQAGQFKVPFLFQQLASSPRQQFVDRSILSNANYFDLGRDLGINVHGSVLEDKLKYMAFVMNGDGANSLNRSNRSVMAGFRLEVPILGVYEYSESDTGASPDQNLGVGVAYAFNEGASALQSATIAAFAKTHHATLDVGYKHNGFSFQGAGVLSHKVEGANLTNYGYNIQAGYFLLPKTIEIAGRAAGEILNKAAVNQYEYAAVLNYFPMGKGHGIKFQTDYTFLKNSNIVTAAGAQGINDHRVRAAMNLIF